MVGIVKNYKRLHGNHSRTTEAIQTSNIYLSVRNFFLQSSLRSSTEQQNDEGRAFCDGVASIPEEAQHS